MKKQDNHPFVEDSRFKIIRKEAICVAIISAVHLLIFILIALFYSEKDPTNYTYLLGFPAWFTACLAIEGATMILLAWLMLKKFKDIPLTADDPEYDYEEASTKCL